MPDKLTRENEQAVVQMLRDVVKGSWGELFAAQVSEVVEARMAEFREAMSRPQGEGVPSWLAQLAARAGVEGGVTDPLTDPAGGFVEENGLRLVRGRGSAASRMITAIAAGKHSPRQGADGWYKAMYGEDDVYKALAASDAVAGGFLIPEQTSAEIIELLRSASVIRRMGPVIEPMEAGKLSIPGLSTGASATYIGENANISSTEPTFRQVDLVAKKLAALVPVSNDLIRRRSGTSNMVRDDLVNALAEKEDETFIRSDGTNGEPKGLRFRAAAANITTVNATINTENVYDDLSDLILGLMNNDSRMIRPAWLMAPRTQLALTIMTDAQGNTPLRAEMTNGRLFGFPFGVTTSIPINLAVTGTAESEVYFVDFADVVIGDSMMVMVDASTEAAYHDGSNVQAAFSRDQTVIRAISEHDLALRHTTSVAVKSDVDWVGGITT